MSRRVATLQKLMILMLLVCSQIAMVSCEQARPDSSPILDAHLTPGDNWWRSDWLALDSPSSIRDSVQMLADVFHVKRVYWRGQQDEFNDDYCLGRKDNVTYYDLWLWNRHLIKEVGVNRLLVQEARKHGMEVYAWATLFDFGGPAETGCCFEYPSQYQMRLTLEHPEWMPVDRYGFRRQFGPIELCYPEARKALIDLYVASVLNGQYDGITFFTYTENYGLRFEDEFGFNQPSVDEYQRRYGIDVRTQDFDKHLWRYLRGEYVTKFLKELKAALKPHNKKVGMSLNPKEPNFPQPWNIEPYTITAGRIYLDWERWVREGIVDDLQIYYGPRGTNPRELQTRTIENCLAAVRGTPVTVGYMTFNSFPKRMEEYKAQGLHGIILCKSEANYIETGYPEQPVEALIGKDIYAAMRVLAQVISGKSKVNVAQVLPLSRHENVLMRRLAATALGTMKDPQAVSALEAGLQDSENSVRCAAARGLVAVHGPDTAAKLIQAVREFRQFQLYDTVSTTLSSIDPVFLPEIIKAARDQDARIRELAMQTLGMRGVGLRTYATRPIPVAQTQVRTVGGGGSPAGVPALLAGLRDEESHVRFLAAQALARVGSRPEVMEALIVALKDADVVVQDRAAVSLAIGVGPAARVEIADGRHTLGAPGPPLAVPLNVAQARALGSIAAVFLQFGEGCTRPDAEWGFRPVGNAILAFGSAGRRRLQAMMEQKNDRQLADRAWQVLYVPQVVNNFSFLGDAEKEAAIAYRMRPTIALRK